jgi:hypothetical protein
MTQQYLRKVQLLATSDQQALDLSQFHIKFSVKQFTLQTPNIAIIRLFNLATNTAQRIANEFTRVTLNAGWEGDDQSLNTIFDGTIVQVRRGRESPVDTYVEITAMDGDESMAFDVISSSVLAGSSYQDRYDLIAAEMKVQQGYTPPFPPGTLPRGRVYMEMAKDALRDHGAATDTNWSIQNGKLISISLRGYLPTQAVEINSGTGMIGMPEQTQDGIQVKALLNSRFQVSGLIKLNNADIQQVEIDLDRQSSVKQNAVLPVIDDGSDGTYVIVVLEHTGDTRGDEYYSDMVCISLKQPGGITPGLLAKGYNAGPGSGSGPSPGSGSTPGSGSGP